jgi:hypothetical protein
MMSLVVMSANVAPAWSNRSPTDMIGGRNSSAEMTADTSTPM